MKFRLRHAIGIALLTGLGIAVAGALQPTPVIVDAAVVRRGALVLTVEDDGRTRVRDRHTVHAPVRGLLRRTLLKAGDPVAAGETLVAVLEPSPVVPLDERSRAEADARLARARAAVDETKARLAQSVAERDFADAELARVSELVRSGIETSAREDDARRTATSRREAMRAAEFGCRVAEFEVEVAAAALRDDTAPGATARELVVRSPIDGVVLRVHRESAGPIEAGAAILELGDLRALEVVADLLSQDAVLVRAGQPAHLTGFRTRNDERIHGELEAIVRRVEPSGYTKISALGVEEQRVDVLLDPAGDRDAWSLLGDGYRVELRIEIDRADDRLLVPSGALFVEDGANTVFVVGDDGLAHRRPLELGRQDGLHAEILAGLREGERVVLHPSALVIEGAPITIR
jgi:HlyD family secretion protein